MKTNKIKGFTIVELTIVIAVIAILAAVLIPTFSSVVEKANQSADIQLIRQANVVLQAATVDGSSLSEEAAIKELADNGIKVDKPSGSDNVFYYSEDEKCYVIWSKTDKKIIFPDGSDYLPSFKLTYDWNLPGEGVYFNTNEYIDTGYKLDWAKDFTITEVIDVPLGGYKYLMIGSYDGNGSQDFNLEIHASSCTYFWCNGGTVSGSIQLEASEGSVELRIVFTWKADEQKFTLEVTQDGSTKAIEGKFETMNSTGNATLCIGARDHVQINSYFTPITVKSLQITTEYAYGADTYDPTAPIKHKPDSSETGSWDKALTTMPAENTTITASWIQ